MSSVLRFAALAVFSSTVIVWLLAIGEICDWGRLRPWWRIEQFLELESAESGRILRSNSAGAEFARGDRIVSIGGEPYRKGMLSRTLRESVPGERLRLGIAPASGRAPFEAQVSVGGLPFFQVAWVGVLGVASLVVVGLSWSWAKNATPAAGLLYQAFIAAFSWSLFVLLPGMFAGLPQPVQTGLGWHGAVLFAALPAVAGAMVWVTPPPPVRFWEKIWTPSGVVLAVVVVWFWIQAWREDTGALGLSPNWLPMILVYGLRRPPVKPERVTQFCPPKTLRSKA